MEAQPRHSFEALTSIDRKNQLMNAIKASLSSCLSETHLHLTVPGLQSHTRGKVRDIYDGGDYLVLVTTDRQSAFDRVLASIPFKGQVLNETSLWWFSKTQHIIPNSVVSSPNRNVTIAKKCVVFPVEFVDLVKNQKLPANILTPTTKDVDHDVPITPQEIVQRGLMTQADYDKASAAALKLFEYGQHVALEHGLILVDTKYEFGKGSDGAVVLIDEVHTPDSSGYWIADSYEERIRNGLEPENIDKEFLRLWFRDHCNPYEDEVLPEAPEELVSELAWRYILLYETITKSKFEIPTSQVSGYV
ncbi:phosphoribosylaminoimidazole-succinocarboxamide synthase, chloroplastic-like [Henckelia pumila]|uniref:phosphoribosylaminoimidazole-succinocarboxamide synthase, chloroplastic-like n=1 Tax=Henckelia pumila TaxID=405737 RepID=UPI003C6E8DA1